MDFTKVAPQENYRLDGIGICSTHNLSLHTCRYDPTRVSLLPAHQQSRIELLAKMKNENKNAICSAVEVSTCSSLSSMELYSHTDSKSLQAGDLLDTNLARSLSQQYATSLEKTPTPTKMPANLVWFCACLHLQV